MIVFHKTIYSILPTTVIGWAAKHLPHAQGFILWRIVYIISERCLPSAVSIQEQTERVSYSKRRS